MTKQVFTVTDLGPGDGGKGGIVHKLCCLKNAHTVLKVGGAQGSHGVRTSRGESFNFSQFGCGTFEGVQTYVSDCMVIDPIGLLAEGNSLKYEHGLCNPFSLIAVDQDALCATPFHGVASRLQELARKEHQKGSVGVGIGETKVDAELHPELAIYVRDIGSPSFKRKIESVRDYTLAKLAPIIEHVDDLWPDDRATARDEIAFLTSHDVVDWVHDEFVQMRAAVRIGNREYLARDVLARDGTVVVESSHGILTDRYYGFHPYTSRLRTIPQLTTFDLLAACGYDGEVVKLGVTRGYQIRHGAGPMVTDDPSLAERLLPGSHKKNNRYQGKIRVGPLDLVSLRYAIDVCGGPQAFNGLAVSWFDQIMIEGKWQVCHSYSGALDREFFTLPGRIRVRRGVGEEQLSHQGELSRRLFACKPTLETFGLNGTSDLRQAAMDRCSETLLEQLRVPVRMMSFGQTENDKVCM